MSTDIFSGRQVKLAPVDTEKLAPLLVRWATDTEYMRLQAGSPARLWDVKSSKDWFENETDQEYNFAIHLLENDAIIGTVDLGSINPITGEGWVGIGIGERQYWGRGYGSEALWLLMRFAFETINLRRLTLNVFEYNPRAIRSYQKLGFVEEGRVRKWLNREGQRYDMIYMAILREEWDRLPVPAGLLA